jgi:hypothetical protein
MDGWMDGWMDRYLTFDKGQGGEEEKHLVLKIELI